MPDQEDVGNTLKEERNGRNILEAISDKEPKSKLWAFWLSFLAGNFGLDWFYLSAGNIVYIIAGIVKIITFGGFGIWWLLDWIRVLTDSFPDGLGMQLINDF